MERLEAASNIEVRNLDSFTDALEQRHDAFHNLGARLSDHGLDHADQFCSEHTAARIFDNARGGQRATPEEHEQFASYMMLFFGHLDAERGWTKQLHLGAYRRASTRRLRDIGENVGVRFDERRAAIDALGAYLDRLDAQNALPGIHPL